MRGDNPPTALWKTPCDLSRYAGGFGTYTDITARKKAEQKVADYTSELEQLYCQLDKELGKARHIHERNLPTAFPELEGISLAVLHRPA